MKLYKAKRKNLKTFAGKTNKYNIKHPERPMQKLNLAF